jgi:hypothetical protein
MTAVEPPALESPAVRRLLILPVIATLGLGACGGNSDKTTADLSSPPVHERGGKAYASVKNQTAATRYCIQALGSWPEAYSAYNEVIFNIPGPGRNYVCKRSQ